MASSVIAPAWREQLAPGGKLVLPLALPGGQKSVAFQRLGQRLWVYDLTGRLCTQARHDHSDWPRSEPVSVLTLFEVYVRQLGPGSYAAQRLVESIQKWDRAGRPKSRWHIRALPADMAYTLKEGEFLLDRKWTKMIVRCQ